MTTCYLRMEGVNLSNFVYDTQDLSAIRGGGLLLLKAVSFVEAELNILATSVDPVTTGASSGLFVLVLKQGTSTEDIRRHIENKLNTDEKYKHATFVVDVVEAGDDGDFPLKKEELIAKNRWRQMQSPSLAVPSAVARSPMPCRTDLVRPQSSDPKHNGIDGKVSVSTFQRRDHGVDSKLGEFYKSIPMHNSTEVKLSRRAEETAAWLQAPQYHPLFTNDLNELSNDGDYGNLNNKVAVIYADGNSFGKPQQGFDRNTQKEFDLLLKAYRSSFMLELLAKMQNEPGWKNNNKYRIETLLWGGDEFMLVVPAWKGWETLQLFYEISAAWKFTYMDKVIDLTHSAGLVFCKHNAPIHRIKNLAQDLAETCKDIEKDNFCEKHDEWTESFPASAKGNYFAFQVLESFDNIHGDLSEYRQKICPPKIHNGALIVDGIKMDNIQGKIQTIKNDEKFSRGRLHGIVKDLVAGRGSYAAHNIQKLTEAISPHTQTVLDELGKLFTGNTSRWLQISELWDYICPKKRG